MTQAVPLNDGEKISLANNISSLKYGPMYLQGPFWSGIEGAHGNVTAVDVIKPWSESNEHWQLQSEWKSGILYTLPADRENAFYVLQEIESSENKNVLVKVTSGDALTVWVNGKQKYIQVNLLKRDTVTHFIMLNLRPGKNQLLVKLFNNFHKQIYFAIDFSEPQIIYRKELPIVKLKKNKFYPISWKLKNPVTPHQDMGIPNVRLVLRKR